MNIVFFGTPDFVVPIAESLLSAISHKLVAVVTNPDRPVGRNQILTPSPVKQWAVIHQISVIDFDTVIRIAVSLKKLSPDLGILAAYGKIIPQEIIDLFPKGILVIHPSLLPKYRGASPIQAAILNGDQETGVSIIQMDEKMDHGPIVAQFKEPINPDETAATLTKRLFEKTIPHLIKVINIINIIKTREQNHSLATYTKLLTKEDGEIDWNWKPEKKERFIRAMVPWPGAFTNVKLKVKKEKLTKRLKILKAHVTHNPNTKYQIPNTSLILDEVQLEGKKPVSWEQFQKAYPELSFLKTCPGREQKRGG